MKQQHIADSVLNRILNFIDDMETPVVPDPAALGAQLDAQLAQPTPPVAPDANVVAGAATGERPLAAMLADKG